MKRSLVTLLIFFSAFASSGCGDFDVVDKSKEVVISKAEYEQLKAAAALPKQVGRYQLHREGYRTWRLDTATGHNCLLLTTDDDWKKPETTAESCAVEDENEAQQRHRLYPSLFDASGNPLPPK